MFKALIFSHGRDDAGVQKAAKEVFEKFAGGDDKAININIWGAVFEIVLEHGGEKEVCLSPCSLLILKLV
jgi:aminopeptidase 2